jgi:hypothetical protein
MRSAHSIVRPNGLGGRTRWRGSPQASARACSHKRRPFRRPYVEATIESPPPRRSDALLPAPRPAGRTLPCATLVRPPSGADAPLMDMSCCKPGRGQCKHGFGQHSRDRTGLRRFNLSRGFSRGFRGAILLELCLRPKQSPRRVAMAVLGSNSFPGGHNGKPSCFAPQDADSLPQADVMLAQKIALETDEVSGRAEHDQAQLAD